jgi:hypothetical protein
MQSAFAHKPLRFAQQAAFHGELAGIGWSKGLD